MRSARIAVVTSLSALLAASVFACGSSDDSSSGDDSSEDAGPVDGTAHDSSLDALGKFDGVFPDDSAVDATHLDSSEPVDASHADAHEAGEDSSVDAPPDVEEEDSSVDAGVDAEDDGSIDAEADAAPDAPGDDGATDAATTGDDGGEDAAPDAGTVVRTVTVVRMGDGSAALSSASTAVFLEPRSTVDGSLVGMTIALPTIASGSNQPFSSSGSATSEGDITTSVDGHYVVLGGYASAPGIASIATSRSATVARVVARVDSSGVVDTSTALTNAFDASNVRGVATLDGSAFWLAGNATATGGIEYALLGATTALQILAAPANTRRVDIFGGQLYGTSASGAFDGAFTIGTGVPTTTVPTATILPGFPTATGPSPYAFAGFDLDANVAGIDTFYVADDRSTASGGGIQKWTNNGTTWTLAATFNTGFPTGVRGLAAFATGTTVTLFATTTESSANELVSIVDDGTTPPASATLLATAGANTAYRGVALSPTP